ncbi:MAG: rod-binding protein [Candidatus Hydrogenedentota bacterium]
MLYVEPRANSFTLQPDGMEHGAGREKLALKEMERFFAYLLLQEMRKTVPDDGLFKQTPARGKYEELMDDVLAEQWAESGQLGLADMLEEQLRIGEMQHTLQEQQLEDTPQPLGQVNHGSVPPQDESGSFPSPPRL